MLLIEYQNVKKLSSESESMDSHASTQNALLINAFIYGVLQLERLHRA